MPEAGLDVTVYALTDCGGVAGSCLGASDAPGGGAIETLLLMIGAGGAADVGTPIYLVVDGWSDDENAAGTFDIEVMGT